MSPPAVIGKTNGDTSQRSCWDPCLYCVEAELIEGGKIIDNVCTCFGCRSVVIDPVKGFILNWFDMEAPRNYLNLNAKLNRIVSQGEISNNYSAPEVRGGSFLFI